MAAHSSSTSAATITLPAFLRQSKADIHNKFVDLEWQQRHRLLKGTQPSDPPSPWTKFSGDGTAERNRYLNVEPFVQNRVRLRVGPGLNDYINASYITVGPRRYIATQGPKDTNLNHFYRMLAAETSDPAVVVMLTQTHEGGREKCFQYYPLSNEESPLAIPPDAEAQDDFQGEVVLEHLEEHTKSRCQVRSLRLRTRDNSGVSTEKKIHHLLFAGWPDFLVPEGDDRIALLDLVQLSAELSNTAPSFSFFSTPASSHPNGTTHADNPRIIHCSAGVGRSGTFIALDVLLAALRAGELDSLPPDRDPIAEIVDTLRQQRMMMVQGEPQFVFLYDVLREQMTARLKATQQ